MLAPNEAKIERVENEIEDIGIALKWKYFTEEKIYDDEYFMWAEPTHPHLMSHKERQQSRFGFL